MQIPFKPNCSVAEYAERGKRFDFPEIKRCPNRKCRNQTMHKHGFYERNCCDGFTWHRIFVRRYCCPSCGATVSFLPLFCLPWFQYSLACLWRCLLARFIDGLSLKEILRQLKSRYPALSWSPSQVGRYCARFLANLPKLELVLREADPHCFLGPPGQDRRKRAKKVLDIIAGLSPIQSFFKLYVDQCQSSFLAPVH